jgi:hypothetical protein
MRSTNRVPDLREGETSLSGVEGELTERVGGEEPADVLALTGLVLVEPPEFDEPMP